MSAAAAGAGTDTGAGAAAAAAAGGDAAAGTNGASDGGKPAASSGGGEGGSTDEGAGGDGKSVLGGGAEGQQAGDKAKAGQSASAGELKITLPDGVEVNKEALAGFTTLAKESGLTSDQATSLVAWQLKQVQAQNAANETAHKDAIAKQDVEWAAELKADKEFGGTKLEATQAGALKAVQKWGGEKLSKELEALGVGNHPELIKAFARIEQAHREDNTEGGGTAGGTGGDSQSKLQTRYPSMYDKDGSPKN